MPERERGIERSCAAVEMERHRGHPPTSLNVTITTGTSGASIRYTTNNTTPTATVGTIYTGPVTISANSSITLKAVAYKTGYTTSSVASALFDRTDHTPTAAVPTFNPANSTGSHPATDLSVTVSTTSSSALIRWTNDGSTPTETHGHLINASSGTIIVYASTSVWLKAMAYGTNFLDSNVVSALFDRHDYAPLASAPVFTPPNSNGGGHPATSLNVTISTSSTGAQMRYTTGGIDPTETYGTLINGTSGTATIAANTTSTLKAIAFGAAYNDSTITSAIFDRVDHSVTCAQPVFTPPGCSEGTHPATPMTVTLTTTTSGGSISFTKDGSTPTSTHGTVVASGGTTVIAANTTPTLKAITFKSGYNDSAMTSALFDRTDPGHGAIRKKGSGSGRSHTNQADSVRVVNYTLDKMGNRTQVVDAGTTKTYAVNNLNQYTTGHSMAVTNGASHEISSYNGTNYQYIGDTYLAKAATTTGNNSYTLFYDALGRCVKRTTVINGGTAVTDYYLYDGEHWIMEYDANGTNISNAIYGREMDEMIERGVNGQGWWYFPDRNGNISVVTDGVNTVRESYRYDAFGLPTVTVGPGQQPINNRFLFTGREWNTIFGFYEYRARAYNPTIGRFMSEDPKGFDAGDYNLYRYCSNDPMDLTDPMGLDFTQTGGSPADWAKFNQGLTYIGENSEAAAMISRLRKFDVPVHLNHQFINGSTSDNGLAFDPTRGQIIPGKGLQSPALILAHELRHVLDQLLQPAEFKANRDAGNRRNGFHEPNGLNKNEENALRTEKAVAITKGEPYRTPGEYTRGTTPQEVPTVTTHTEFRRPIDSLIPRPVEIPDKSN